MSHCATTTQNPEIPLSELSDDRSYERLRLLHPGGEAKPVTGGDGPLLGPGSAHRSQPERGDLLSFDAAETARCQSRVKDEYLTRGCPGRGDDRKGGRTKKSRL